MSFRVEAALALVACGALGCAGRGAVGPGPQRGGAPVATVRVGACADPSIDGVVGARVDPRHADRDLDDDGAVEVVVADRTLCTPRGNCYWNLFGRNRDGCRRYLGTIAGVRIERLGPRGDLGYHDLRSWWRLGGRGRFLVQEHRFRQGGYQLVEARVCRQQKDDRLLCAEEKK